MIRLTIQMNQKDSVVKDFEDDESLLNYMMDVHSEWIPPVVYEVIEKGYTVYGDLSDKEMDEIAEETCQDPWDGVSLVRWISDDFGSVDIDMSTEIID